MNYFHDESESLNVISSAGNTNSKVYISTETDVTNLYKFLHIFKSNLMFQKLIKEDHDSFICSPYNVYDSYKIHAEFEKVLQKAYQMFALFKMKWFKEELLLLMSLT